MFTGIITGVGRIAAVHDLGSSSSARQASHHRGARRLPRRRGPGRQHRAQRRLHDRHRRSTRRKGSFTIDISAESLDKTAGLARDRTASTSKKRIACQRPAGRPHRVRPCGRHRHRDAFRPGRRKLGAARAGAAARSASTWRTRARSRSTASASRSTRVADFPDGTEISINLIPHTVQNTALGQLKAGSRVNLEIDLIARYVERMLTGAAPNPESQCMSATSATTLTPVVHLPGRRHRRRRARRPHGDPGRRGGPRERRRPGARPPTTSRPKRSISWRASAAA